MATEKAIRFSEWNGLFMPNDRYYENRSRAEILSAQITRLTLGNGLAAGVPSDEEVAALADMVEYLRFAIPKEGIDRRFWAARVKVTNIDDVISVEAEVPSLQSAFAGYRFADSFTRYDSTGNAVDLSNHGQHAGRVLCVAISVVDYVAIPEPKAMPEIS